MAVVAVIALAAVVVSIPLFIAAAGGMLALGAQILHSPGLTLLGLTDAILSLCRLIFYLYSIPSLFNNVIFVLFATVVYYDLRSRLDGPLDYPAEALTT